MIASPLPHPRRLTAILFIACLAFTATAGRIWFDGSTDDVDTTPGLLLSDNEDYWGDVILTGVTYTYEVPPDKPADDRPNRAGGVGRTLLNGNQGSGKIGRVGLSGDRPLVVIFDFKRSCDFTEWDIVSTSRRLSITLDLRENETDPWQSVFSRGLDECPDRELHRLVFAERQKGRFARLTVQAPKLTELSEVVAWGDAVVDEAAPEEIVPTARGQYPVGIAYPTITGIAKTSLSDREAYYWVRSLTPEQRAQQAVWSRVPTWDAISDRPIAPASSDINQPIHIVMTRNETEAVAVALKNTLVDSPRIVEPTLAAPLAEGGAPAPDVTATLGVFGVIGDRGFGNNLGPIFTADNLLGPSLMQRYLLNGRDISSFPTVTLPPSGSAIFWLSFSTRNAAPGSYVGSIGIADGERLPITIEVLDVTLPNAFAHVKTYSANRTRQFPFEFSDRAEREIAYGLDSGITDWGRLPESDWPILRRLASDRGMRLLSGLRHLCPGKYVHNVYTGNWTSAEDLPENAAEEIAEHVRQVVAEAQARGLDFDEWYGSTGDEPGARNIAGVGAICRLIKAADPRVNIYVNPCFWTGYDNGGTTEDAIVHAGLADWYADTVDISMPLFLLLRDHPSSWSHFSSPRLVNSYYYVSGHLDRAESALEIQKYRRMAWDSLALGFNGWAFYSWYSPRASAWNHFDRNPPGHGLREPSDYQMLYPGPRGLIPTRHSESLREGYEDWRLIHLLQASEGDTTLAPILQAYRAGTPPLQLRQQALQALSRTTTR